MTNILYCGLKGKTITLDFYIFKAFKFIEILLLDHLVFVAQIDCAI